jgi:hypothetical protein
VELEMVIARERLDKHSRGNGFAHNNRGAAVGGVFYAILAEVIREDQWGELIGRTVRSSPPVKGK